MPARRSSSHPLEWITDQIVVTDATVTNGRIGLRLDRDEIAEIHKVIVTVDASFLDDAADDLADFHWAMSLDPDIIGDPEAITTLEDLEVFAHGTAGKAMRVGAAGQSVESQLMRFDVDFPDKHPVLAGSDIGWSIRGDANLAADFTVIVYMTRRKSRANEKFNVLLARR